MELTCSRCHQTVQNEDTFCPFCGLPQLVYSTEAGNGQGQQEQWTGASRDASQVDWKPALRSALALAVPAGLFCSIPAQTGIFGLFLMGATAAWVVALYMRTQRPAWITIGAGARIGLVTGILAGTLAFSVSSAMIFMQRYAFHQGTRIDTDWNAFVDEDMKLSQQIASMMSSADAGQISSMQARQRSLMLSPEGHAGFVVANLVLASLLFIFFAATGGAICARVLGRSRRPQT